MNTQQKELYQNIQKFSLDDADAVLSFTQRLAKDNGWTLLYGWFFEKVYLPKLEVFRVRSIINYRGFRLTNLSS